LIRSHRIIDHGALARPGKIDRAPDATLWGRPPACAGLPGRLRFFDPVTRVWTLAFGCFGGAGGFACRAETNISVRSGNETRAALLPLGPIQTRPDRTYPFAPGELTGALASLRDEQFFEQVCIDHGALARPGKVNRAPDAMYAQVANRQT
jgi:hypothetical protein